MARPAWVIGSFVTGIAVGFALARWSGEPVDAAETTTPALPSSESPGAPAPVPAPPPPVRGVSSPGLPPAAIPAPAAVAVGPDAEYAGYSQPVDTGPVFRKVMDQKTPPGTENRLGDLHRTLERELRDDSWAYPMEAELQNSLVAETSAGKLTVEHLECRATLCELRLSGTAANEQALTDWTSAAGKQPWASRLYMNLSSSISDGDRIDSLLIFRRPTR